MRGLGILTPGTVENLLVTLDSFQINYYEPTVDQKPYW